MLKVLVGITNGVFLYANPEARQITAGLLRAQREAVAPTVEDEERKTPQNRLNEVLTSNQ